jgi:hypothetical protein
MHIFAWLACSSITVHRGASDTVPGEGIEPSDI